MAKTIPKQFDLGGTGIEEFDEIEDYGGPTSNDKKDMGRMGRYKSSRHVRLRVYIKT